MLISPFFWLLAGLSGHSAANRRLTGKRLKSQGAKLSFSSVSVRWGCAGAFSLPGKTGAMRGRAPGTSRVRARRGEEKDTVRDLLAAGALLAGLSGHSAANRRQVRETPEKPRSRAQLFKRFCAWGMRRGFCPARENRSSAWACTRKEPRACAAGQKHKPGARLAHRRCATCSPQVSGGG